MTTNVNDLDLPMVESKFIPSDLDVYQQLEQARQVSKDTWIAKTIFGYAILRNKEVDDILSDKRWHNALSSLIRLNPYTDDKFKESKLQSVICLEGEDHTRIKKLVLKAFTKSNIDKLRPHMREYMNILLDECLSKKNFDLQKDVYNKYPVNMICKILGVPDDDWILFNKWTTDTFKNFGIGFDENISKILETQKEFNTYTLKLIEDKKNNLTDDLLSHLIQAEEEGDKLTFSELVTLVESIIVSGIDTTRSQLGLSTILISQNNKLWLSLVSDEESRNKIIEESIRMDGVLRNVARFASEDIIYKDILFPKDTPVLLSISSGNYDESIFINPDEFDYQRENLVKNNLGFGGGIHHCLGVVLARAELQEALSVVASRLPNLSIKNNVIYKDTVETIWGATSIPIEQ